MISENKKVEIFSGTGGVGKTTLATTRALHLASQNKKVLLITIDPSKRLKEVLNIEDESAGHIVPVKVDDHSFHAMLMNPEKTIERISLKADLPEFKENRIVNILAKPNGGLNEILSLVELKFRLEEDEFDTVLLDTPPGSHFLDFLESSDKIESFFDKKFIEIFKYLTESKSPGAKTKIAMSFISSGVKKLISYLEKVTGSHFIEDFIQAVSVIYKTKDVFFDSLKLKSQLKDPNFSNWFLVTSASQNKVEEALSLYQGSQDYFSSETIVLLNKCLEKELNAWTPETAEAIKLKDSFLNKELKQKQRLNKNFSTLLEFEEIFFTKPLEHIRYLGTKWSTF